MNHEIVVVLTQTVVEIDHTADETRRKNADAAVVEQIDAGGLLFFLEDGIVAEMRIAMDHTVAAERKPPGGEHRARKPVTHGKRFILVVEQAVAFEPIKREQT